MSASSNENVGSAASATSVFSWKGLRSYLSPMDAKVNEYEKKCEACYLGSVSLHRVLAEYCGGSEYRYGVNSTLWRVAFVRNCNSHHVATVEKLLEKFKQHDSMFNYSEDQSRLLKMVEMLEEALPTEARDPEGYISRIITATRKYTAVKWPGETAATYKAKMTSSAELMFATTMLQPMDLSALPASIADNSVSTDISLDGLPSM